MQQLAATMTCLTLGFGLLAAEVRGDLARVADFSTAATCRDADGLAFSDATGKLFAARGNTLFEFGLGWRLEKSLQVDQRGSPVFNGIEALPTGNLLLVSAKPGRLYEISPLGQTIATKDLGDRVVPLGVAYCCQQDRVYLLDGADQTVKQYSTAAEPETVHQLGLADPCALEVPQPGVFWVLDGRQRKIFSYAADANRAELIDLAELCDYQGPSGLALDRGRGILYVCFAASQRIVGVDVSGVKGFGRTEPQVVGRTPDPAQIQIPSPYPASTIVVKPPHPPTIYVLPIIVRGDSSSPAPLGGHRAASTGWPAPNYGLADGDCPAGERLLDPPDLAISDLEVTSLTGSRITFRYLVINSSASPANLDGVIARAVVSSDVVQNHGDKLVGYQALHGKWLGPRQSRSVTGTGVVQQGFSGRPFLLVKLDTADRLAESNEDNNTAVTLISLAR